MENHAGKRRRLQLCRREQRCARQIVGNTVPGAWRVLLPALQSAFGDEVGRPSRTREAYVIRCLRRELRFRLVLDQIVPDRPRELWSLHDDGTWAWVRRHQNTLFEEVGTLARAAVHRYVAGVFVGSCVNEAMRNHINRVSKVW